MTLEAQPTNEDLNAICYPEGGHFDPVAALDALATVVDDLVYLGCSEELQVGVDVAKLSFNAYRYPSGTDGRDDRLNKAGEEFNRMGCEDLRYLLAQFQGYYVGKGATTELRLLSSYLLNRKVGGQCRADGSIALAKDHEGGAEHQLRCLTDAAKALEE